MKIAALILAHEKPHCLKKLLDDLRSRGIPSYVNIDRKSDISKFRFVEHPQRFSVRWGGYSQVLTTISLLQAALIDTNVTHFYLMSGRDFLVRKQREIESALSCATNGGNFIKIEDMPYPGRPMTRFTQYWFNDVPANWRVRNRLNKWSSMLPARDLAKLLPGVSLATGDQWWLLSRSAVVQILDFVEDNEWFLKAFRYTDCPDEHAIQTAFKHLQLKQDGDCPTFTRFLPGTASPLVIDEELYNEARIGGFFAARKFDTYYPKLG